MSKILNKLAGSKIKKIELFSYLIHKGVFPLIRYTLFRILSFGKHARIGFLGKGVSVIGSSKLQTGKYVYIGMHTYLNCICRDKVIFEDNVTIREYSWLQLTSNLADPGVGLLIKKNTYIGPRAHLGAAAFVSIGEGCQIGAGFTVSAENHKFSSQEKISEQGVSRMGIEIADDCWIGNNVIVLDGVRIGKGCVIGAGSVVVKSIPDFSVAVGNPCKVLKSRY